MNKKLLLIGILVIVFVSGCTTKIIIPEPEKVINPVFVEKTITNVKVQYFRLSCFDEKFNRIDTRNITTNLYLDEYVSKSRWEGDWLKTTINYPIIEFYIDVYDVKANYGECDFNGAIKIEIKDSNDVPYFKECRIESGKCVIDECSYEVGKQINNCLDNIK